MTNSKKSKIGLLLASLALTLVSGYSVQAGADPTRPVREHHGNAPGFKQDFKDWMGNKKVKIMVLIDDQGQTMLFDANGQEIQRCGQVDGTTISGNCKFANITTTSANEIRIQGYTPPVGAVSMNDASGKKAVADDPCMALNIGGILYAYCWK